VQEVFVYGDSLQAFCVAIVVPKKETVESLAKEKGIIGTYEEHCRDKAILTHFL